MDGAPIFSLFRSALPAAQLLGLRGILNSTTNLILGRMENGESFDEAVKYAQAVGLAETDPAADVDGWDAAIKVAALVSVLMDIPFTPQQVDRTGIRSITPEMIADAKAQGKRWKLVCSAERIGAIGHRPGCPGTGFPRLTLLPRRWRHLHCPVQDGCAGRPVLTEKDPTPDCTAYGLLADFVNAVR